MRSSLYPMKTIAVEVGEIVAKALPQFARSLLEMTTKQRTMGKFHHKATAEDVQLPSHMPHSEEQYK